MVARITTPASMQETLNYNEHKVKRGVAECIAENQFPMPATRMNFYHKLHWLQERNELNSRAKTKTLHVSLNFDPSESFSNEKMVQIANGYMLHMGMGEQPYLVYRHFDAGHPHLHILATLIREDGSRIDTHNIARDRSEPARKFIEEYHGLIHAERQAEKTEQAPVHLRRVVYGKSETKRSIANVLKQVLNTYNYASLAELNAVLQSFGVMADRGSRDSFTYSKGGLLYRLLDHNGVPTGVPIKASTIAGKPTLTSLEERFDNNKFDREIRRLALQVTLDKILGEHPPTLESLIAALQKQDITTVLRQNAQGRIYGITFVDHRNKSVFNGSGIGKAYSIAGLFKQLNRESIHRNDQSNEPHPSMHTSLLEKLFQPEDELTETPRELKQKKKKRNL